MAVPSRRSGVLSSSYTHSRGARRGDRPASAGRLGGNTPAAGRDPRVEPLEPRRLMAVQPTAQLINAATDQVIATMSNGMTIDMGRVGTRLNIRGLPSGSAGSLQFRIDGATIKTESFSPYTIGGDNGNDYYDWTPPTGTHTLQVIQYGGAGGSGAVQGTTTLSFTALAPASPPVVSPPPVVSLPPVVSPPPAPAPAKLPGTPIGTPGSYNNGGNTIARALDDNLSTYFDAPASAANGAWVGLDLGSAKTITQVSYAPRSGWGGRMVGGRFQASNAADFSAGVVDLHTVTAAPAGNALTTVAAGTAGGGYRFVRYLSPANSYGNVAEVQFAGRDADPGTVPPVVPPPPPPPPTVTTNGGDSPAPPGAAPNGGSPAAVIRVIGQPSGVAGHPVVVNALSSGLPNSALFARYQWDFGDPAGAYNRLPGWTAGHVYDRPGTYPLTLTVTDGNGGSSTTTTTISVQPDYRRVVFVDAYAGNDAAPGTLGSPVRSFDKAAAFAKGGNVKVLFRRGQAWTTNGQVMSITGANVHIGAYGTGANPVINVTRSNAIQTFAGATHVVIEGLTFDSPYKPSGDVANKTGASGIFTGGTAIAVRDCTFLNIDDAVNANQSPNGLIVQDNDAPLLTGLRSYLLWAQGNDIVALGNSAANSTREHIIRASDATRLLVAFNNFANPGRPGVDNSDINKGTIEMQRGSWAYIYGNTTRDGPVRVGPRGEDTEPSSTNSSYTVVENNRISNYQLNVNPGTHHLVIRGNTITNNAQSGIGLTPSDPQGRNVSNIYIMDNVGYNYASTGRFLRVEGGLAARAVTVGRNRYVAPNMAVGSNDTAGVSVSASNLVGFKAIFDNVWPVPKVITQYAQGGVMWVYGNYSGQVGYKDPAEWLAYPEVTGDVFRN